MKTVFFLTIMSGMKGKTLRLYNILFPIWLLVWFPSLLWLLLIPGNFLIDYLVLRLSLQKMGEDVSYATENVWKVCLYGFLSDFAGAAVLFGAMMIGGDISLTYSSALNMNPFRHPAALLTVFVSIVVAGFLIYILDKRLFRKDFSEEKASRLALNMALFTAPYLFLFPSTLLYP